MRRREGGAAKTAAVLALLAGAALFAEGRMSVLGVTLNLTAPLAYFIGIRYGHMYGLFGGAFIGAMADGVASQMLGPDMLGKATAGYMGAMLRSGPVYWNAPLGVLWIVLATAADGTLAYISLTVFGQQPAPVGQAAVIIFIQSATVSLAGLFLKPSASDHV